MRTLISDTAPHRRLITFSLHYVSYCGAGFRVPRGRLLAKALPKAYSILANEEYC